jgi:biopolymer transport protein ExbD
VPNKLKEELPTATELQKLQERSLIVYIMVGGGQIQFNNEIVSLESLPERLQTLKNGIPVADQPQLMSILKIDKSTSMGLVTDIKKHLREAGVLTIHYAAINAPPPAR